MDKPRFTQPDTFVDRVQSANARSIVVRLGGATFTAMRSRTGEKRPSPKRHEPGYVHGHKGSRPDFRLVAARAWGDR